MNDAEKVAIVQKQIERLHTEVLERVKAFSALWRTVILGVAGILALRGTSEGANFGLAVLISPALALLVLAYWLNEQGSLVVVARAMAREEEKLNDLAGSPLLTYEQDRLRARGGAFAYRAEVIGTIGAVVSIGYFGVAIWLLYSEPAARYRGHPAHQATRHRPLPNESLQLTGRRSAPRHIQRANDAARS